MYLLTQSNRFVIIGFSSFVIGQFGLDVPTIEK